MLTLVIFLVVLGVLVLSHEFGHFIAARKSGMKVHEFGFGFPPRVFGIQPLLKKEGADATLPAKKWRVVWGKKTELTDPNYEEGTVYSFNLIPLGGFVRIKGEEGQESGPDSFVAQSFWKKLITLIAGVAMNVLLAVVLLSIGFASGIPQAVNDAIPAEHVSDRRVEIVQVIKDKPADQAGLQPGDAIIRLDNLEMPRLNQVQEYINANKDKVIHVVIRRDGEIIHKDIKPFVYEDTGRGGLGVSIVEVGLVRYPWYKAVYYGFTTTGVYLKEILLAFYGLIRGLFVGAPVGEALSGPVGIAVLTGKVARLGFAYLLNFTALLSLNLAILNILPIPALDGGRVLFLLISKIIGKPVTPRYEQIAHTLGFLLLMILVVIITVKDLGAFSGFFRSIVEYFLRK